MVINNLEALFSSLGDVVAPAKAETAITFDVAKMERLYRSFRVRHFSMPPHFLVHVRDLIGLKKHKGLSLMECRIDSLEDAQLADCVVLPGRLIAFAKRLAVQYSESIGESLFAKDFNECLLLDENKLRDLFLTAWCTERSNDTLEQAAEEYERRRIRVPFAEV